jgi:nitrous oxidase accessory protein NosD
VKPGVVLTSRDGPVGTVVEHYYYASGNQVLNVVGAVPPPTIEGLTIAHGWDVSGEGGAGIYMRNSSPIIRNNLLVANSAGDLEGGGGFGAAIEVAGGSPTIEHNTIVGNLCDFGAVDLYLCTATVVNNVICYTGEDTTGRSGMGVSCWQSPSALVSHNLLWKNWFANIQGACSTQATLDSNLVADPKFCNATLVGPATDPLLGDWGVHSDSPLAPGGVAAGWGASLGTSAADTPTKPITWGQLKARYR